METKPEEQNKPKKPQKVDSFEAAVSQLTEIKKVIRANEELSDIITTSKARYPSTTDDIWEEVLNYAILRLAYEQFVEKPTEDKKKTPSFFIKKPTEDKEKTLLTVITFSNLLLNITAPWNQVALRKYITEYFSMRDFGNALPRILQNATDKNENFWPELVKKTLDYITEINPESPVLNSSYAESFPNVVRNIIAHLNGLYKYSTAEAFVGQLTSNEREVKKALNFYCFAFLQSDVIAQHQRQHGLK